MIQKKILSILIILLLALLVFRNLPTLRNAGGNMIEMITNQTKTFKIGADNKMGSLSLTISGYANGEILLLIGTKENVRLKVTSNNYFMEKIPSTLRNLLFLKHSNRTTMLLF